MLTAFSKYQTQVFTALCVFPGQILGGFILSWTAPLIPKLNDASQTPLERPLSDLEKSLLASVLYITGLIGLFMASWVSNYKGRRPALFMGAFLILASFVILCLAKTFAALLVGRLVVGLGLGHITVINIIYIGEIASTNIRGILLTSLDITLTFGALLMVSIGPYVSYATINYLGAIISLVFGLALFWIPESPVFYVIKGDEINVKRILVGLNRLNEMKDVCDLQSKVTNTRGDWNELFTKKCNRRGLFIMTVIMGLQYLSGMLVVQFFATSIFEIAESSIPPDVATIIIVCTQQSGGLVVPFVIESFGRRLLLLCSTATCCLSMTGFGLYFYLRHIESPIVENVKWIPLVILVIFYLSNNMGFGTIPSTLTGEMFSGNARGKGTALVTAVSWLFGFAVTTVFNTMLTVLGPHYMFWFFASTCGLAFLFTLIFIPETKGKALIEIQEMLENKLF